jgi:hypothetical protein
MTSRPVAVLHETTAVSKNDIMKEVRSLRTGPQCHGGSTQRFDQRDMLHVRGARGWRGSGSRSTVEHVRGLATIMTHRRLYVRTLARNQHHTIKSSNRPTALAAVDFYHAPPHHRLSLRNTGSCAPLSPCSKVRTSGSQTRSSRHRTRSRPSRVSAHAESKSAPHRY